MRRVLVLVAVGMLGLAGCGGHADERVTAPVASAGAVLPSVPETRTPQAETAAPTSRATAPAQKPKARPSRTGTGGAGSGNAGLDEFVAAVQRQLPEVALDRRDEEVEDLGEQACDGLAAGEKDTAVAAAISEQGVAPPAARKLVTLARSTACAGRPKVAAPHG